MSNIDWNTEREAFVRALQARLGVTPDGKPGAATRAALDRVLPASAPAVPPVMPRPADAVIRQGAAGHIVREIIVHCAATQPTMLANLPVEAKVGEIDRWHKARGWRGIGYHYVIDRDGSVARGRPETEIGAHVEGRNAGTIGICLWGGHGSAANDPFDRHFTPAQDAALRRLIADISARTPVARISGHNEYAAKACPGFHVPTWLKAA